MQDAPDIAAGTPIAPSEGPLPTPATNAVQLSVEYLPLDALIPYARNSRDHSKEQVREIAGSIAEFGWTNPVLIDHANVLVAGHGRVLAAELLKVPQVPCIRLGHLTETQVRAYRIADNRIPLNASWNPEMLGLEMRDLRLSEFNVKLLGFTETEMGTLGEIKPEPVETLEPLPKKEVICPSCGIAFSPSKKPI